MRNLKYDRRVYEGVLSSPRIPLLNVDELKLLTDDDSTCCERFKVRELGFDISDFLGKDDVDLIVRVHAPLVVSSYWYRHDEDRNVFALKFYNGPVRGD
ncbi:MAG: hypothetical protein V1889_01085 [archaeon]